MEEETKPSIHVMEGMYVSPDINLQLVTIQSFKDHLPVEWQVFGISNDDNDDEEYREWSCVIQKKVDDDGFCDDVGNEVYLNSDSIQWADGTLWKKMGVSSTQMYLMTRRRPIFYTPLLVYLCFLMFDLMKSYVLSLKDKIFVTKKMTKMM